MHRSIRALAAAAALVIAVAACSGTSSPAPSASPGPSASAAPSGGTAASAAPSAAPSATPEPSVDRHAAPDLEALLADEIGGVALSKVSLSGADFVAGGTAAGQAQLTTLLEQLGRTAADLTVAEAHDPGGRLVFQEGLFRVVGADPRQLLDLWVTAQQAATGNRIQVATTTVAGRELTHLIDPSVQVRGNTYVFADGDTLWLILADDTALLEEALGKVR